MVTIYKVAAILVFSKIAVYFKLNYLKLIHLQANMLSSFIFTYFAMNHTNLPQKFSFRPSKTQYLGHSLKVAVTFCIFNSGVNTNLTNYKVLCKNLMQLSTKVHTNQGPNISFFIFQLIIR